MANEIKFIYLQFTDRRQAEGLALLREFAGRVFPGRRARYLVVDNAREERAGGLELGAEADLDAIAGDNRAREFTGYEKGFDWYRRSEDDLFVVANDTFHVSYGSDYLKLFTPELALAAERRGAILGYADGFPRPIALHGLELPMWIRTSFFVAPGRTLKSLLPFALQTPRDQVFEPYPGFFRADSPLSANYREYLRTWLFAAPGEASEFRDSWHSKRELTEETHAALAEKAWCILSEHWLSARALERGIPLITVNGHGEIRRPGK